MSTLSEAKEALDQAVGHMLEKGVDNEYSEHWLQRAQASALIAITEQLAGIREALESANQARSSRSE